MWLVWLCQLMEGYKMEKDITDDAKCKNFQR